MKHGAVRKLMRAATLSLLALGMTSGVAGAAVWAASPAMAQADDQNPGAAGSGSGSQPGGSGSQPDPNAGGLGGLPKIGGLGDNLTGGA